MVAAPSVAIPEAVWVWGMPLIPLDMSQTLDVIDQLVAARRPSLVITPNLNYVMIASKNPDLPTINQRAALSMADGMTLVIASRWKARRLPERVTGSDLIFRVSERAAQRGYRLFFLGGADGVAAEAAENLKGRYAGLQVVGIENPILSQLSPAELESPVRADSRGPAGYPDHRAQSAFWRTLARHAPRTTRGSRLCPVWCRHRLCRWSRPSRPAVDAKELPRVVLSHPPGADAGWAHATSTTPSFILRMLADERPSPAAPPRSTPKRLPIPACRIHLVGHGSAGSWSSSGNQHIPQNLPNRHGQRSTRPGMIPYWVIPGRLPSSPVSPLFDRRSAVSVHHGG